MTKRPYNMKYNVEQSIQHFIQKISKWENYILELLFTETSPIPVSTSWSRPHQPHSHHASLRRVTRPAFYSAFNGCNSGEVFKMNASHWHRTLIKANICRQSPSESKAVGFLLWDRGRRGGGSRGESLLLVCAHTSQTLPDGLAPYISEPLS